MFLVFLESNESNESNESLVFLESNESLDSRIRTINQSNSVFFPPRFLRIFFMSQLVYSLPSDLPSFDCRVRRSEFTDNFPIRILTLSWNVGGRIPDPLTLGFLRSLVSSSSCSSIGMSCGEKGKDGQKGGKEEEQNKADVVLIGLQESVPLTLASLVQDLSVQQGMWRKMILQALGENEYIEVGSHAMFGILSSVFVHMRMIRQVKDVAVSSVGTGMSGVVDGNKGGVGIRVELFHSAFTFINLHLSHAHSDVELRNSEYDTILAGLNFKTFVSSNPINWLETSKEMKKKCPVFYGEQFKTVWDSDFVFLLGDCNYHIDMSLAECLVAIENKNIERLVSKDQLLEQRRKILAFAEFCEAPIKFEPTYKFIVGSNDRDTTKGINSKVPSYCDRIFYVPTPNLIFLEYNSIPEITHSDHKPVYAMFQAQFKFLLEDKLEKVNKEAQEKYNKWLRHFKGLLAHFDSHLGETEEDFGDRDESVVSTKIEQVFYFFVLPPSAANECC